MEKAVLIVEDEEQQLNILRRLVRNINQTADIYLARNAAEAYRTLMERTIDVFVVDIILEPEKSGDTSGFQLIDRLRKIPKYMFTPVIVVSARNYSAFLLKTTHPAPAKK